MTLRVADEVAEALAASRPVVALESTIIAHGLPRPDNLRVAREIEAVVREPGAVPATIAVLGGEVRVGLDDAGLERLANGDDVAKCALRDLPVVSARGADGATTVAATAHLAARAGIGVFATGGIGGVHREARDSWDESADLVALGAHPDHRRVRGREVDPRRRRDARAPGDAQRHRARLPHRPLPRLLPDRLRPSRCWRVDIAGGGRRDRCRRCELGAPGGMLLANPLPEDEQVDPALHDRVLRRGLGRGGRRGRRAARP